MLLLLTVALDALARDAYTATASASVRFSAANSFVSSRTALFRSTPAASRSGRNSSRKKLKARRRLVGAGASSGAARSARRTGAQCSAERTSSQSSRVPAAPPANGTATCAGDDLAVT